MKTFLKLSSFELFNIIFDLEKLVNKHSKSTYLKIIRWKLVMWFVKLNDYCDLITATIRTRTLL